MLNIDRKFGIQVKIWNPGNQEYEWKWLHPTGKSRYEFVNSDTAHQMKEMCYPHTDTDLVRVCEIQDGE